MKRKLAVGKTIFFLVYYSVCVWGVLERERGLDFLEYVNNSTQETKGTNQ